MSRRLAIAEEAWPIAGAFNIARGSKTEARVIVVSIEETGGLGRGECVPYARYGETPASVSAQIESIRPGIEGRLSRQELLGLLPGGAARNAVDCALWDLEAKTSGIPAWRTAGVPGSFRPVTAFTISLAPPESMALAARAAAHRPILKLKLGGPSDLDCVVAVREAAPDCILIADVNEGWSPDRLAELAPALAALRVALIEQPLPADQDDALVTYRSPVPLCADESYRGPDSLARVARRYQAVNVKLDKSGGLTAALRAVHEARESGLEVMIGCMVATSLSMAPALLLTPLANYVDLDGPLLLARDRAPGLRYAPDGTIEPAPSELWG